MLYTVALLVVLLKQWWLLLNALVLWRKLERLKGPFNKHFVQSSNKKERWGCGEETGRIA